MLTTFIIGLREYLEVFLIIGVFLGINKKLSLNKNKEILSASFFGILLSLIFPVIVFYFKENLKFFIKKNELFEGLLLIFSGFFISYIIFSIHKFIHKNTDKNINHLKNDIKINKKFFDLSLFFLIIFFIFREGIEIALFTAATTILYNFYENIIGLTLSFIVASIFGILIFIGISNIPIKKIYKITEWLLIFLGGSMIINGINELIEFFFNTKISNYLTIYLNFLPDKNSFFGHFLKTFFTLKQEYSLIYIGLLFLYILLIKKLIKKTNLSQ